MGRNVHTNIPQSTEYLIPQLPNYKKFKCDDKKCKYQQKLYYDRQHRTRPLPLLPDNTSVLVTTDDKQIPGRVISTADTPPSYIVDMLTGILCRNRSDLNVISNNHNTDKATQ